MPTLKPILAQNAQGDQVKAVQTNLTKIGLTVPATETSQSLFGAGTTDAIKQFQAQNKLPVTGVIDAATQAMLNNAAAVAGTNQSQVSGQLAMDYGLAANGVTVRLYSIGYGGVATKLAEAKTDANGVYSLA
jgi:peptidoglycan hydrolase-like protein with peptidoglycan-binding domain